jgi:hypothetical protein
VSTRISSRKSSVTSSRVETVAISAAFRGSTGTPR